MADAPLAPYPTPEAQARELERLADATGAELVEYGRSHEGRPLQIARVPCTGTREGAVLVSANIHGLEWIAGRVALGLLERLARPVGALAELRARAEILVAPCLNPDGHHRTFAQAGRGKVRSMRANARGVDLNRNFPLPAGARPSWLPVAGSSRPGSTFFRGEAPLSEPETRALDGVLAAHPLRGSVNLHSFMGTLIPPRVLRRADFDAYRALCAAYFAAQPRRRYRRLASFHFDAFTGEQEDHQHHRYGTWAVCAEVFPVVASFRQHLFADRAFWRFNPRRYEPWVDNEVPGIAAFLLAALARDAPARGPSG